MKTKFQYAADAFAWTLVDIALLVFASCTFAYEIVLFSRMPIWSWYPLSIIFLGFAFALQFRFGERLWRGGRFDSPTLLLISLGVLCAAVNVFTLRPDADDFSYLHRALFGLLDLSQPIPIHHTAHDVELLPALSPVHLTTSIEVVAALVAKALSLNPLFFCQQIVGNINLFIFPFIHFLLLRYLGFSQRQSLVGVAIILVLFLFSGDSHQDWGNFTFLRAWQGKCILITLVVPLTSLLTFRFLKNGFSSDLLRMHLAVISAIGLSGTAFFLTPFAVGFSILGAIFYQYKNFHFFKRVLLLGSVLFIFAFLAVLIEAGALPRVSNVTVWQLPPGSVRPEIYILGTTVFLKQTTALFFLISSLGILWLKYRNARISALVIASLFMSVAIVTPPISSALIRLTLVGAYWRLAYATQMLLIIGIFALLCLLGVRNSQNFGVKLKFIFGLCFIVAFVCIKKPALNDKVISIPQIFKFDVQVISLVNLLDRKIPKFTVALVPEELVPALGLLRPDIRFISTRELETHHVFVNAGREKEGQLRIDAQLDLRSCGNGGYTKRIIRKQPRLNALVFPEDCAAEKITANLAVNNNEWVITALPKYQLWSRVSAN